ncbi:MAG: hypothetical protein KGZ79_09000 [Dethiobacter sp.]|nr:hypothetical protein [Dethiobacter sp.]
MSFNSIKETVCPLCENCVHFLELNIGGLITSFDTNPSFTVTGVTTYERTGIFCAVCFDKGEYVQIGKEGEVLPPEMVEQELYKVKKTRLHLVK